MSIYLTTLSYLGSGTAARPSIRPSTGRHANSRNQVPKAETVSQPKATPTDPEAVHKAKFIQRQLLADGEPQAQVLRPSKARQSTRRIDQAKKSHPSPQISRDQMAFATNALVDLTHGEITELIDASKYLA